MHLMTDACEVVGSVDSGRAALSARAGENVDEAAVEGELGELAAQAHPPGTMGLDVHEGGVGAVLVAHADVPWQRGRATTTNRHSTTISDSRKKC